MVPHPATPPIQQPSQWRVGERIFRDRNHDGRIDWEASGNQRGTDGYDIIKEDTDYDGFYDRMYKAGGISPGILWEQEIHERVPVITPHFTPIQPQWNE